MIAVLEANGELEEMEPVEEALGQAAGVDGGSETPPESPLAGEADKTSRRNPKADE
ncbi:hypothetical protein [Paenibacillus sophorae]|nr:hypothetical protein [Paenibacillus sophorae]QWU15683.1 hypothetical protein KP014_28355 [Paenibacillus sophorae]